jgi:hypothetical protein
MARAGETGMLRFALAFVLVASLFLIGPNRSYAACKWVWDCSGDGPCRHKPVCQSSVDLVPPEPPDLPPLKPIRPVKPPETFDPPPVGATICQQRYVCDGTGQCAWRRICQ